MTGTVMLASAACALGLVLAVWAVSVAIRDVSIIDIAWGLGFVLIAWVCFALGHGERDRRLLLAILVTVWGLRLAGHIGKWMAHVFAPIGFNWQICVALVPGLAAREVAVSSLATVYAMSATGDAGAMQLGATIATQWSLATALSLLAWYVFAPQCMSTLAVIKRETNSWRNVWIAAGYLFGLAYLASLLTYQIARLLS